MLRRAVDVFGFHLAGLDRRRAGRGAVELSHYGEALGVALVDVSSEGVRPESEGCARFIAWNESPIPITCVIWSYI
jgi:hypothetical protein